MEAITRILARAREGDPKASDELLPLVYDELRAMARRQLAGEPDACTLVPTVLVHEAWLRLGLGDQDWDGRAHFFGAAARAMRQICVDHARRRCAARHGGKMQRDDFTVDFADQSLSPEEVLALDQALDRLSELDDRAAQIVILRHFGGFTVADCAQALDLNERTVYRDWSAARAWLGSEMP